MCLFGVLGTANQETQGRLKSKVYSEETKEVKVLKRKEEIYKGCFEQNATGASYNNAELLGCE